jgi:hypothetical protein
MVSTWGASRSMTSCAACPMLTVAPRSLSIRQPLAPQGNRIMSHDDNILLRQKASQERVFRLAQRDHGLTLKAISLDSGLGYTTVQSYAKGEAVMSIASLFRLVGVIPNELLSLLLPEGQMIVSVPANIDLDDIAAWAEKFSAAKLAAHRADSECAEQIGPNERSELTGIVVAFPGSAAA